MRQGFFFFFSFFLLAVPPVLSFQPLPGNKEGVVFNWIAGSLGLGERDVLG